MDISQYIELYNVGKAEALNCDIAALEGPRRVALLEALERHGFEVKWHTAADGDGNDDGVVVGRNRR